MKGKTELKRKELIKLKVKCWMNMELEKNESVRRENLGED
jgi:hypothetical protein